MSTKSIGKQSAKKVPKMGASGKGPNSEPEVQPPLPFFPFARYTSIVGVHTTLLSFTGLFLPRTTISIIEGSSSSLNFGQGDSSSGSVPRLPTLTENPLRTVAWVCVGTFILQVWWASWIRGWSLDTRDLSVEGKVHDTSVQRTEQKLQRQEWNKMRLSAFWAASLCTVAASFVFSAVAILFGAPLSSHYLHTYLLGLLVSLLTVFTPAYTLGMPSLKSDVVAYVTRLTYIRLFAELSPRSPVERAVVYPAVGAIFGCWLGAIPAGLDWEEPWQRWPLTTSYGALVGFILGSLWALGVSATRNLANLNRQSSPSSDVKHQFKAAKKLKA